MSKKRGATENLARWKRAVVHLEPRGDSVSLSERIKRWDELREAFRRGEMKREDYLETSGTAWSEAVRDRPWWGTAVFVRHSERRFLVTARHVLFDEESAREKLQAGDAEAEHWPEEMRAEVKQRALVRSQLEIFNFIFRVPAFDEVLRGFVDPPRHLMNLGAGGEPYLPYTFSSGDLDLAVVSLEREPRFAKELEEQGFEAISSDSFVDGPSGDGAEVFTVGFPAATTCVLDLPLTRAEKLWRSPAVSLPVFAFGRVSMSHQALPFFWCDLSAYPGNSGGPVVEGDRLVGIISGQALTPLDEERPNEGKRDEEVKTVVRIPFAKAIRTKHVVSLLDEQIRRDLAFEAA